MTLVQVLGGNDKNIYVTKPTKANASETQIKDLMLIKLLSSK